MCQTLIFCSYYAQGINVCGVLLLCGCKCELGGTTNTPANARIRIKGPLRWQTVDIGETHSLLKPKLPEYLCCPPAYHFALPPQLPAFSVANQLPSIHLPSCIRTPEPIQLSILLLTRPFTTASPKPRRSTTVTSASLHAPGQVHTLPSLAATVSPAPTVWRCGLAWFGVDIGSNLKEECVEEMQ